MDEQQSSNKKLIIALVVTLILGVIVGILLYVRGGSSEEGTGTTSFSALFGNLGEESGRPSGSKVTPGGEGEKGAGDTGENGEEPLFRRLTDFEVAGATTVSRDGRDYVRYVQRETGYVYDVDPKTGKTTQLTNTTIPRIYEAYWGLGGNAVVLRYLKHDDINRKDIIKTQIASLVLPNDIFASSSGAIGNLTISEPVLRDDISSVSVSPNGKLLFYIVPVADGVSGTIVNLSTRVATEVLRNSFGEWLPQILDNGNVILTSKASSDVYGYAYLYDTAKKTLSRLVREKNGLTTFSTPNGGRMLYSENLLGNTILGLYDAKGFAQDEGGVTHTAPLQLATLPEKCAWSANGVRAFCGAFASTPRAKIPDEWYQGALTFTDTFWTMDTDIADLVFLADPKKETGRTFDVTLPMIDKSESHFYFIDKTDSTLWSMRLDRSKYANGESDPANGEELPPLTPEELKDALGSMPSTTKSNNIR